MQIKLSKIRLDGGTQSREMLIPDWIEKYTKDLHDGIKFDPIEVVFDGTDYWCWDGFHRCAASRKAKIEAIEANVTQGTLEDAQWLSLSANKKHGIPRSNRDKKRAVKAALAHPKGKDCSNYQIADHCGVSEFLVRKCRQEKEIESGAIKSQLQPTTAVQQSSYRTGRDGKQYPASKLNGPKRKHKKPSTKKRIISPEALPVVLGHSLPNPMIALSLPPKNPALAAATIINLFDAEFIRALISELNQHLQQGEIS
jgi:hypothetical protein